MVGDATVVGYSATVASTAIADLMVAWLMIALPTTGESDGW